MELQESPSNVSGYTDENLEKLTDLLTDLMTNY